MQAVTAKAITQRSTIEIISGESMSKMITEPHFRKQWADLHNACPWATSMQSLPFLEAWYNCYKSRFEPLVVAEYSSEGELIGLLPLAVESRTQRLTVAGDNLCEYPTWLALAENGNQFIQKALDEVVGWFPNAVLNFMYLAAGTPLEWINDNKNWGQKCVLRKEPRPLLLLEDGEHLKSSLKKKGNRSRFKQMERMGAVNFVQLNTAEELEAVFDEVQTLSDLRISAVHGDAPNYDSYKKQFYLELLNANLLHATLLKVDDRIASANLNLYNRDAVLIGLTALSPFFVKQSPSKLHITMLGLELLKQGFQIIDLTPGGTYKDRHANSFDEVHILTIYFNIAARRKFAIKRKLISAAKKGSELAGVEQKALLKRFSNLKHKLKFVRSKNVVQKLASKAHLLPKKQKEMRVYKFNLDNISVVPNPNLMNRDCLADLLKYEPTESWHFTPSEFHNLAIERLSEGSHVYTRVEAGKLVHCGWLNERQENSFISEVNQHFTMEPESAVLFDFFTHPEAQGKGLYQAAMRQMLNDASRVPNTRQVYICVLADNAASRHSIEKIGFEYKTSLFG